MPGYLTITTPAADLSLAPIAALRVVAGLAADDASRDAELTPLGLRISAEIVDACRIAVGEGGEPTLRKERLTEVFESHHDEVLILSRRHDVEIITVTQDGRPITLDARSLRSEAGLLFRWIGGVKSHWNAETIEIVYDAGFEVSPASLVGVVTDLAQIRLSQAAVDPLVKSTRVETVDVETIETERWVGATPGTGRGSALPPEIMARLERFMNRQMR